MSDQKRQLLEKECATGYVNRDWDKVPTPDETLLAEAKAWGMSIIHICIDSTDPADDGKPVSFLTMGSVPSVGDTVEDQLGTRATVISIHHRVIKLGSVFMLIPNIHARKIKPSPA